MSTTMNREEILNAIANMSVMDIVELVKDMEEKFGVSAAQSVVAAAPGSAESAQSSVEEKTEFTVKLTGFGDTSKINVIKAVRSVTTLALKEAKDLVESTQKEPAVVKENVPKEEAEKMKQAIEKAGGTVSFE